MDVQTAIHVRPPVLHFRQGVPADLGRFIRAHPEDRGKDLQSVCLKACRNISATLFAPPSQFTSRHTRFTRQQSHAPNVLEPLLLGPQADGLLVHLVLDVLEPGLLQL